jgi:hypothetical protein
LEAGPAALGDAGAVACSRGGFIMVIMRIGNHGNRAIRTIMEIKAIIVHQGNHGKSGQSWKIRAIMENQGNHGKSGQSWKIKAFMEIRPIVVMRATRCE